MRLQSSVIEYNCIDIQFGQIAENLVFMITDIYIDQALLG